MTRKIIHIDVSKMSEKEICEAIGRKYIPWYKDLVFWSIILLTLSQSYAIITFMKGI